MKRRQHALTPAQLWALKNGEDRAGQERSWQEVATLLDLKEYYVRASAAGTYKVPKETPLYDPRDVQPELKRILTDEDVARWQATHLCLCGCGSETKRETNRKARAPHGAYRMFTGSHIKRMPWVKEHLARYNGDPARRRKAVKTKLQMTVDAGVLADDIREWKLATGELYKHLALRCRVNPQHVSSILARRIPRISRVTAAKLMLGIGQPLRPELAQAYISWCQRNDVPIPKIKIES